MKVVGIICEYNPFHNGHLYHLNKAKEIAEDGIVIAILTGYFSMPVFYGEGHHVGVTAQWKITPRLQIYAKYSGLFYTDGREQIGSQTNEIIDGNKSTQIRFTMVFSM